MLRQIGSMAQGPISGSLEFSQPYASPIGVTVTDPPQQVGSAGVTVVAATSGVLYDDLNLNGVRNTNEAGVAGVGVQIAGFSAVTTDANGVFVVPIPSGAYQLEYTANTAARSFLVPDRILVAFIAELKPYGFWGISGPIAELS